jgi:transcriptional regulator GlxA family with amidase domain
MNGTEAHADIDLWGRGALRRVVLPQQASNGASGRAGRRPATQESRLAIFAEAVEILADESSRPLRIGEVAGRLATSPRQLQRIFADVAGIGFRSYLRRLRMSKAAGLLAATPLPVKEVARRVGYGDASQFSKAFNRTYGMSPSQCRAMARARRGESGRVGPSSTS